MKDSFMQEQLHFDRWIEIDGQSGTFYIQADLVNHGLAMNQEVSKETWPTPEPGTMRYKRWNGLDRWADLCDAIDMYNPGGDNADQIYYMKLVQGYGARLSTPGYLDCTEWAVFKTAQEAKDYLEEMYGDDDYDCDGESSGEIAEY